MISFQVSCTFLYILTLSISAFGQSTYAGYQISFPFVTSCPSNQYFDTAALQCSPCPTGYNQKANDFKSCECSNSSYYYGVNQGGGSLTCVACNSGYIRSSDGYGCVLSPAPTCNSSSVTIESLINGALVGSASALNSLQPRVGSRSCESCVSGTIPDQYGQRCIPCAKITPRTNLHGGASIQCCTNASLRNGICLTDVIASTTGILGTFSYSNGFGTVSAFIQEHIETAFRLCRMNLNFTTAQSTTRTLLANSTACQILGNIAAMQMYASTDGQAFYLYDEYIWQNQRAASFWTAAGVRYSIPFLVYPATYYEEITSGSYNWIPSTYKSNSTLDLRFAKYSAYGQYLGLVDGVDGQFQLCNGGYSDGRAALTFASLYRKFCYIRAAALWNSPIYETAFYDPYLVFTRSGVNQMIPTPVVVINYVAATGSTPNRNGEEASWTYHRRFFTVDRLSGVNTNQELTHVRYAKSIRILTTLTTDTAYLVPPLIIIEYDQITAADVASNKIVEVKVETEYRMNQDIHIRDIWIAVGVILAVGFVLALLRTNEWQTRMGKTTIDLVTMGKAVLFLCNVLADVFFVVMVGVALWWLIFFKNQQSIYMLLPAGYQQVSFMSLVILAFIFKSIDILHLTISQSSVDVFFIDWEKPREERRNAVSVWRTYFVANEFIEIQTFRRINPTFQILFVLLLLKVVNLENIAANQTVSVLFPSSSEYLAPYNPILRIGIAFSMWAATGLVQYLYYMLFHRYFIENRILNFIDLCSVSNISVIMFLYNHYGYYIHGRSPFGRSDVNLRDMSLNLERESMGLIGTRGLQVTGKGRTNPDLQVNVPDQTFIIRVDKPFRDQYNVPLSRYLASANSKKGAFTAQEADALMTTYRTLNSFFCAFIDHSLVNHNYIIRFRTLAEQLLNSEFQCNCAPEQQELTGNFLFVDRDNTFTKCFFCGNEHALIIWNAATFFFVDFFAHNYVLAAILTYITNLFIEKLRESLARKNVGKKGLIPKDFLF